MNFFILFLTLVLTSCASRHVYIGEHMGGSKQYIDKLSVEYLKNNSGETIVRYWEIESVGAFDRKVAVRKKGKNHERLKERRTLLEISCDRQKIKFLSIVEYDDEGRILSSRTDLKMGVMDEDGTFSPWMPISPRFPVWWASYRYLCK